MPLRSNNKVHVLILIGLVSLLLILASPSYTGSDSPVLQYHVTGASEVIGTQASNPVIAVITPVSSTTSTSTTIVIPNKVRATQVSPPVQYNSGSVEAMIMAKFGSEGPHAIQVARCESGLHPTDTNGQYMGLFQLGNYHRHRATRLGYSWSDMLSPQPNINVAYDLFIEQGWTPWSCRSAIR